MKSNESLPEVVALVVRATHQDHAELWGLVDEVAMGDKVREVILGLALVAGSYVRQAAEAKAVAPDVLLAMLTDVATDEGI